MTRTRPRLNERRTSPGGFARFARREPVESDEQARPTRIQPDPRKPPLRRSVGQRAADAVFVGDDRVIGRRPGPAPRAGVRWYWRGHRTAASDQNDIRRHRATSLSCSDGAAGLRLRRESVAAPRGLE